MDKVDFTNGASIHVGDVMYAGGYPDSNGKPLYQFFVVFDIKSNGLIFSAGIGTNGVEFPYNFCWAFTHKCNDDELKIFNELLKEQNMVVDYNRRKIKKIGD